MESTCCNQALSAQNVIQRCRDSGMRCTKLVNLTIELLVKAGGPLTAKQISGSDEIADRFDRVSVHRLIARLEENGIVRRFGFRERAAYYAIRDLHDCDDYIVCTACGGIEKLQMACPVAQLQRDVASTSGYHEIEHELKFFGVCAKCSAAA